MELIVYTPPVPVENEAEIIADMLQMGVDRVHLRHPGIDIQPVLSRVPQELMGSISIHDQFNLLARFNLLGGIHLNGRNPIAPKDYQGKVSKSFHSVKEIEPGFDYVTLSPIFPSISKPGYGEGFTEDELAEIPPDYVVALGGVNFERIARLKRYPFKGIALLGAVWQSDNPIKEIDKYVYSIK